MSPTVADVQEQVMTLVATLCTVPPPRTRASESLQKATATYDTIGAELV